MNLESMIHQAHQEGLWFVSQINGSWIPPEFVDKNRNLVIDANWELRHPGERYKQIMKECETLFDEAQSIRSWIHSRGGSVL